MAVVPLPDNPTLRARFIWNKGTPGEGGIRLYIGYGGSSPTAPNCAAIATALEAAWTANIAPLHPANYALEEVDVLDIASNTGFSGQWTGSSPGTRPGNVLPDQCAINVEFNIAQRYRGGKPRCFLPPGVETDLQTPSAWDVPFVDLCNTNFAAFRTAIAAIAVGAVGPFAHVALSYYDGYDKNTPPWRGPGYKYPPAYRPTALTLQISGVSTKTVVGSQKRRRTSTSP